jgi:hypothetical protein
LPFGHQVDIPSPRGLTSISAANGVSKLAERSQNLRINLPFNDILLPLAFPSGHSVVTSPGASQSLPVAAPVVKVNGPQLAALKPRPDAATVADERDRLSHDSSPPSKAPLGVINLPFYQMHLPLARVHERPEPLPPQADILAKKPAMARFSSRSSGADSNVPAAEWYKSLPKTEGIWGNLALSSGKNKFNASNESDLTPMLVARGVANVSFPTVNTASPNRLNTKLSVMNFPFNSVDMPLSKVLLPFARLGGGKRSQLFAGLPGEKSYSRDINSGGAGERPEGSEPFTVPRLNDSLTSPSSKSLSSLLRQKTSDTKIQLEMGRAFNPRTWTHILKKLSGGLNPQSKVTLHDFGLPYSFINNPLAFMNLPFAYISLPFAKTSLPFTHLHTPFAWLNPAFIEMQKHFGSIVPAAGVTSEPDRREQVFDLKANGVLLDRARREAALPRLELYRSPSDRFSGESNAEHLPNRASHWLDSKDSSLVSEVAAPSIPGSKSIFSGVGTGKPRSSFGQANDTGSANRTRLIQDYFNDVFSGAILGGESKSVDKPGGLKEAKQVLARIDRAAVAFGGGEALASVPDLSGSLGKLQMPLSTFVTPYSLLTLPFSFLDNPMAFNNLPLSHFNLPLSHLSLPFSAFGIPFGSLDTPYPKPDRPPEHYHIKAADYPPSKLQSLDPENRLTSYLNLPISEMNLPFTFFRMPLNVFDMPFAHLLLPFSELNTPFTSLHMPLEMSQLPLSNVKLPFPKKVPDAVNYFPLDEGRFQTART